MITNELKQKKSAHLKARDNVNLLLTSLNIDRFNLYVYQILLSGDIEFPDTRINEIEFIDHVYENITNHLQKLEKEIKILNDASKNLVNYLNDQINDKNI